MSRVGIPKAWPVLLGIGPLWISRSRVLGELASWAVQQSPYPVPENLEVALLAFLVQWPHGEDYTSFDNIGALERTIMETIGKVPEIQAWNERKNKREGPSFVSRYSAPRDPDDDFIDLDALARNIAMACWHDAADDKNFNDDFNERHNKSALPRTD